MSCERGGPNGKKAGRCRTEGDAGAVAHRRLPGKAGGRRDDGCLGLEREHHLYAAAPVRAEGRRAPHCVAQEEVQRSAAGALLEKLFEGSAEKLFAALLGAKRLSKDELARLEAMVAAAQEEEQP